MVVVNIFTHHTLTLNLYLQLPGHSRFKKLSNAVKKKLKALELVKAPQEEVKAHKGLVAVKSLQDLKVFKLEDQGKGVRRSYKASLFFFLLYVC